MFNVNSKKQVDIIQLGYLIKVMKYIYVFDIKILLKIKLLVKSTVIKKQEVIKYKKLKVNLDI